MENNNSAIGITSILIDFLNKKYDNIRDLDSLVVNLVDEEYDSMVPVIDSIIEDENNHIGKIQQLIDLLSGSGEDIEEGKQDTLDIIDNSEFMESITTMKKKLILSENFDNVVDDVQAVADPVFVGANEEHDENKKRYEDAMKENEKEAEETIPKEGDTGKKIKSKALKAMHLSENLFDRPYYTKLTNLLNNGVVDAETLCHDLLSWFSEDELRGFYDDAKVWYGDDEETEEFTEDLSQGNKFNLNSDVYNALADICFKYAQKGEHPSRSDLEQALEWFDLHFWEEDDDFEESLNESLDDVVKDAIEYYKENAFGYSSLKNYVETDFSHYPKDKQKEIYRKMKKVLHESLNESYVSEWWGQVDGDTPKEVAKRYNLKVRPIKRRRDEILYKFEGSLEDIEKAMNDGYFYSLTVNADEGHSEDVNSLLYESIQCAIAKEQLKKFKEGKMPKTWNADTYIKNLTEKKHITKKEAKSLKEWYSHIK